VADKDIEALAETAGVEPRGTTFSKWAGTDRLLLALVFTDIVGSTALNEAIKDERMNAVRRAHFAQSRKLIADWRRVRDKDDRRCLLGCLSLD
jgi:class 3 adenylate cyclase